MVERTEKLYLDFDPQREKREALEADQQDEDDLKALETKIKGRSQN
jgi:hypothetical protein